MQTRERTRTTKPNEHQANEHPPFVRAPGTSSTVRSSRTRRTTLRAGPSTSQDLSRTWRRWAHSKHCGQRSTRAAHSFLMPSKSTTQFIAEKTHSFMVGRECYTSQGQPFFGVRDASRSSISRRTVLKWTRLAIRAVVCADSVGLPLPRPPQLWQARPRQAPCRSAGARLVHGYIHDRCHESAYVSVAMTTATGQAQELHHPLPAELLVADAAHRLVLVNAA